MDKRQNLNLAKQMNHYPKAYKGEYISKSRYKNANEILENNIPKSAMEIIK